MTILDLKYFEGLNYHSRNVFTISDAQHTMGILSMRFHNQVIYKDIE